MSRAKCLFIFLLLAVPTLAQVPLGGFAYVPSSNDSILGASNVTITADANCTLLTATNCTVVTAQGGATGAPYTGSLYVTSSVSLTAMRDIIVPLASGKDYRVCNLTSGAQRIRVIAATGNGYAINNGQCALVFALGPNYNGIGGQLPVSPANGGTGQDFSSATGIISASSGTMSAVSQVPPLRGGTGQDFSSANGYLRFTGGVASVSAGVTPGCGGITCANQYITGAPTTYTTTTAAMDASQTTVTVADCTKLVAPGVALLVGTTGNQNEWIPFSSCTGGLLTIAARASGFYGTVTGYAKPAGSAVVQVIESRAATTTSAPTYVVFQNLYQTYYSAGLQFGGVYQGATQFNYLTGIYVQPGGTYAIHASGTVGTTIPLIRAVNPDSGLAGQAGQICTGASNVQDFCMGINSAQNNSSQNGGSSWAFFRMGLETVPGVLIDQSNNWNWGRSKTIATGLLKLRGGTSGDLTIQMPSAVTSYTLTRPAAQASAANQVEANDGWGNMSWVTINVANKSAATITAVSGGTASCGVTTCTAQRGRISLSGGALTTGNIVNVTWGTAFASTPLCSASLNGGATDYRIGTTSESTTGFTVTAGMTVTSASLTIDYTCAIP